MANKGVQVVEVVVVDGKPVVRGTVGEVAFEASTFQWGSKMLMKVEAEGLDRGTRIAIGHKAKSAIKAAGMLLPEAVLKRPRKAKAEEAVVEAAPAVEAVDGGVELESLDAALEAV